MQEKFYTVADKHMILIEGEMLALCFGVLYSSAGLIRLLMQE